MKKLLSTLFLFAVIGNLSAEIAVKSFIRLELDQNARIISPKIDQNGKKCAIIRVETPEKDFVFDFGLIGNALATEQHVGEIWITFPDPDIEIENDCYRSFGRRHTTN